MEDKPVRLSWGNVSQNKLQFYQKRGFMHFTVCAYVRACGVLPKHTTLYNIVPVDLSESKRDSVVKKCVEGWLMLADVF